MKKMQRVILALIPALALTTPVLAQGPDAHAGHAMEMQAPQAAASAAVNDKLPPDAEHALAVLKASPRHGEWADIAVPGSPDKLKSFVVYPERRDKAPVVIVIHEIFGLSDWVRGVADQLAKEGFIAIAPDFLSGKAPNGGGTAELGDQATQAIRTLTPADLNTKLDAVREYGAKLSGSNGKTATIGFCWGGQTSFAYALYQPVLNAAVSYYGPMPAEPAAYAKAKAPILGLYGGNDAPRVNGNIPLAQAELKKAGVTYDPHVFEGAGHGFLRQQSGSAQAPGNMKATEQSWPLAVEFLKKYTK
jgi:carboxymethylenebutenolidase